MQISPCSKKSAIIVVILLFSCSTILFADTDKTDIKYALVEAIEEGDIADENLEEAKAFLEKGADINALSKSDGCASLHYSALQGQKKLTEFLLANGADVNTKDTVGTNALQRVAFMGDIEMARLLIKRGIDVNNKGGFRNRTALHLVARNGREEMVKLLIANGANANAIDENGWTPLRHASRDNHVEVMKMLIAGGADINPMKGRDAWSPLSWAAEVGDYDLVKLLIAKGADVNGIGEFGTALNGTTRNGHFTIAEFLISKGAEANIKGKFGRMPLHNAAIHGHLDIARLLIANGADVNIKDDDGKAALDYAHKYKHKEIAELLRKYGGERPEERVVRFDKAIGRYAIESHYHILKLGMTYDKTIANVRKWALEQFADGPLDDGGWAKHVVKHGLMEAEADLDFDGEKELFLRQNVPARVWTYMVFTPVEDGYRYLGNFFGGYFKILPISKNQKPQILVFDPCGGHLCFIRKYINDGKKIMLVSSEKLSVGDGAPEGNNKKINELFDNFEESIKFVKTPAEIFKKNISNSSAKTVQTDPLPVLLYTPKNGERNNISNKTVVVEIDSKKITYDDIRVPELVLKQLKLREPNDIRFRKIKKSIEYNNLKQKVEDMILPAAIKQHKIIVSDKERDIRVAEQLEIVYGTKVFTEENAEKQNELKNSIINLLETWHNDNERGEALYLEKFSKEIEQDDWEIFKKQYATKEDLDELKHQWPIATVEKVYSVFREAAVRALSKKKLVDKLRKIGKLGKKEEYKDWLNKKLASAKFLREDIIRFEKKRKAETLFRLQGRPVP